jgi:hypothetical protein
MIAAALDLSPLAASASCGPNDPTGYYQGTVQSKEAGALKVSLNLRCDRGSYAGEIATPAEAFQIRSGSFSNGQLSLTFGGAAGEAGSMILTIAGTSVTGSYTLGADSGTVGLTRIGEARTPLSTAPVLNLSAGQWRDDLHFEIHTLETRHPAPFTFTPRARFEAAAAAVERRLGAINGDAVYVGLDRLANLIGDGHTYVEFPPQLALMPLSIERFGNEYRVVEVESGNERLLGLRVIGIGGVPVADVHRRFYATMTPVGETRFLRNARATDFLNVGMALHGIGVTAARNEASYTLASDRGIRSSVRLRSLSASESSGANWVWVSRKRPLYRTRPEDDFWFTYLASRRTLYCSFRGYENLAANAASLFAFERAKRPDKLAIDMRLNGGGDYKDGLRYLIDPIRALPSINRKGHLFVLIGTSTFSAAMANAAQFRIATHAILVGQTIGERPNSYQEPNEQRLPNSHLLLRYSTQYYEFAPGGPNEIVPDKTIIPSWDDVKKGRDPVLDWVLARD